MPTTLPSGQTPRPSRPGTKDPVRGNPSLPHVFLDKHNTFMVISHTHTHTMETHREAAGPEIQKNSMRTLYCVQSEEKQKAYLRISKAPPKPNIMKIIDPRNREKNGRPAANPAAQEDTH